MVLPTITLEEHFLSKALGQGAGLRDRYVHFPEGTVQSLEDLSPNGRRMQEMDAGHVTLQVISHCPGASSAEVGLCRAANDELAQAIKQRSDRLAGFACIPMAQPEEAAVELERCVKELGFVGALVDNHTTSGEWYDDERFWVVFEKAQQLDVPIYIHPTFPTPDMARILYNGNYGPRTTGLLGSAALGWHSLCGVHVMRLFAAGVFDRFPTLKIVIGHDGEMLPFQLERCDKFARRFEQKETGTARKPKTLKEAWDENIYVTTSAMFSVNPMATLLRNTKRDRILYSVDWPFAQNQDGWQFLEELGKSGLLEDGELEMIAYKNAERLLGVKAKQ